MPKAGTNGCEALTQVTRSEWSMEMLVRLQLRAKTNWRRTPSGAAALVWYGTSGRPRRVIRVSRILQGVMQAKGAQLVRELFRKEDRDLGSPRKGRPRAEGHRAGLSGPPSKVRRSVIFGAREGRGGSARRDDDKLRRGSRMGVKPNSTGDGSRRAADEAVNRLRPRKESPTAKAGRTKRASLRACESKVTFPGSRGRSSTGCPSQGRNPARSRGVVWDVSRTPR